MAAPIMLRVSSSCFMGSVNISKSPARHHFLIRVIREIRGSKFALLLGNDDLEGIGGGMGREGDGVGGAVERKLMGDKAANVEFAGENQAGDFGLQQEIGGVAADEIFFVDADGGEVEGGFNATTSMGEEEDLAAATDEGLRFADNVVGGYGDDGGVEGFWNFDFRCWIR